MARAIILFKKKLVKSIKNEVKVNGNYNVKLTFLSITELH